MSVRLHALPLLVAMGLLASLTGCHSEAICINCSGDAGAADSSIVSAPDGQAMAESDAMISTCEPTGDDEVCNELDDDCDGKVDEDFDLDNNPAHCGDCGTSCNDVNVDALCEHGKCKVLGCQPGYADRDEKAGCEYRCPVFPARKEDCNGVDDDCDTKIDEDLVEPSNGICRHRKGTPCENVGLVCDTREGITTWYCDYPSGVQFSKTVPNGIIADETLCDGIDNDCDGIVDDPWPELGQSCHDEGIGVCRDEGIVRCVPDDTAHTYCDLSALPDPVPGAGAGVPELCNGVDDDCDGIVDNADPSDPKRVLDEMVHVTTGGKDFWIYAYEASRPDADASAQGKLSGRSCSRTGTLPWTFVSYAQASAACASAGKRLCSGDEWQAACEGAGALAYPYAASYATDSCNGADHDAIAGGSFDSDVVVSGSLAACVSAEGAFDLSGNVREWTTQSLGTTGGADPKPIYVARGGSYLSPEQGLTCQTTSSQASAGSVLPTLGFRCCSDTAP